MDQDRISPVNPLSTPGATATAQPAPTDARQRCPRPGRRPTTDRSDFPGISHSLQPTNGRPLWRHGFEGKIGDLLLPPVNKTGQQNRSTKWRMNGSQNGYNRRVSSSTTLGTGPANGWVCPRGRSGSRNSFGGETGREVMGGRNGSPLWGSASTGLAGWRA